MDNLKKFAEATNGELYDPDWKGGSWSCEAVETQETLDQYAESSKDWASSTVEQRGEIAGFPFIAWKQVQAVAGQPRRAVSVIDFGTVRIAVDAFIPHFV